MEPADQPVAIRRRGLPRRALLLAALALATPAVARGAGVRVGPEGLAAALAEARPGSVLLLEPGDYAGLSLRDRGGAPGTPVTIRAADPAVPPRLARLRLRDASHLVLTDLVLDYRFAAGDTIRDRPFEIRGGSGLRLSRLLVDGDLARGRSAIDDGHPTAFGLALTGVADVTIEETEIRRLHRGLVVDRCRGVTVRNCLLHGLRSDGMNFAAVQRLTIEGNTIRDFARAEGSRDHPDMIQFWTNGTTTPATDIVIRRNRLLAGTGGWTQSIFMRNEEVDTGRAGTEMFYRNVLIEENFIHNAHAHGITVGETRGLVIRRNTVVRNPAAEGPQRNPSLWTPMIRVARRAERVAIEANVTARIIGHENQPDWRVERNLLVQGETRMKPGHYSAVFAGDDPTDPASFRPRPGGPLDGSGIGAPAALAGRGRP